MHDIDRTQQEYNGEALTFETEYTNEEAAWPSSGTLGQAEEQEQELAAELLSVSSEAELDQFLGNLIRRAAGAVGKVVRSPIGQAVGSVLKSAAKRALPIAGGAIGGYFGGPLGAKIGSGLASAAGNALGLEAETLSQEELQYEGAKQFVRFATDTTHRALSAAPNAHPSAIARAAAAAAAKQFAPNLLGPSQGHAATSVQSGPAQSGRWIRRGSKIIVIGV